MRRARASLADGEDLSLADLLEDVTPNGMPEKEEKPEDQGRGDHWENEDGMRSYQGDMDDGTETQAEEESSDDGDNDDDGRASSEDDSDVSDSYLAEVATTVPRSRVQDQKRQEQEQPTNALVRHNHFDQYAVVFEQSGATIKAGTATAFAQVPLKENFRLPRAYLDQHKVFVNASFFDPAHVVGFDQIQKRRTQFFPVPRIYSRELPVTKRFSKLMKRRGFGADAKTLSFPFRSHIEHILMELSLPGVVCFML